ncbi:MAG: aminotransferase class I/II-fold pyridoxal phosphate-dependent enzyme, partial [Halobacteria archaeon]|nr:aminotransferase class I/II-fold pyridoxal phosphate-dependent enzyme [Halobacteria archaeon]
ISAERIIRDYDDEKIVYITSPNNPTGGTLELDGVEKVAEGVDALVIVDEAYWEFSTKDSAVPLVAELDNLAVTRTFSKAFGLAGMRVGYGVVPAELASAYRKVVTPFCVGTPSLYAAMGALEDEGHLQESVELARWGRDYMSKNIDAPTFESEANFVLVDVSPRQASDVAETLEKRGII